MQQIDKSNMLKAITDAPTHILPAYDSAKYIVPKDPINSIIVAGIGGSAIAGKLLKEYVDYLGIETPLTVNNTYDLPENIGKDTLVFISSYSGETEETLSCMRQAMKKGCQIVGVATGGTVKQVCDEKQFLCIMLPKGLQPRAAMVYGFFPILRVLVNKRLIPDQENDIKRTVALMKSETVHKKGAELGELFANKLPVIYASSNLADVAYRWKTQINENAKTLAICNHLPELDHNEINGYGNLKIKPHVVMLRESHDHERVKKRFDVTKDIIKSKGVDVSLIDLKGESFLANMFAAVMMGDFASYYLAIRYATDPSPVSVIESLKKQMGKWSE